MRSTTRSCPTITFLTSNRACSRVAATGRSVSSGSGSPTGERVDPVGRGGLLGVIVFGVVLCLSCFLAPAMTKWYAPIPVDGLAGAYETLSGG